MKNNEKFKKNAQEISKNEQNADKEAITISTADVKNSSSFSYVFPKNTVSFSSHSSLPQPQGSVRYYDTSFFEVPEWFQIVIDDLSNHMEIRQDDYSRL